MKPSVAIRAAAVLVAPLVAVASPCARAQLKPELQTGSMIPVQPKAVDPREAGIIRKHFAQCIYHSSRSRAIALLNNSDAVAVDMAAAKITDVTKDLGMERCLGDQVGFDQNALGMKFSPGVLRDLMAEEAYLAANRAAPQLAAAPAPLQANFVSTGDSLAEAHAMVSFTDCAILKDIGHADALLRTMPGSPAERATAAALAPALGDCLVKGQQVTLSPAGIRGFVAYAMWNRFGRGAAQ
ncbi:hypothetical protein [Sphingomonas pruni]|jgi:hypothetical protein|uniref:hypothetical protein n=1 Tax=Sphingomonas pruni TaxID=40683 RepID=UPI000830473B|nr:hypothetical protein [Sphingomonas pruni]